MDNEIDAEEQSGQRHEQFLADGGIENSAECGHYNRNVGSIAVITGVNVGKTGERSNLYEKTFPNV